MSFFRLLIFIYISALFISTGFCAALEQTRDQTVFENLNSTALNPSPVSKQRSDFSSGDDSYHNNHWAQYSLMKTSGTEARERSAYKVTISGLPTDVNQDARILPHVTRLLVQCDDKTQLLKNYNYPASAIFHWSSENCGDVFLQIGVKNITLNQRYEGIYGFLKFLWDFSSGERVFMPEEFPSQERYLNIMRIKYIRVSYELYDDDQIRDDFPKSFLSTANGIEKASIPYESVSIKGLPTGANPDAHIHPHATRLEVHCTDELQILINRNYPIRKMFKWSSEHCVEINFQIEVGSLILSRKYAGDFAFAKFLQDFASGERNFYVDDFPHQEDSLRSMGIKYIKVKYEFNGDANTRNGF